jgi:agmatine/peptidylarginine deiminase
VALNRRSFVGTAFAAMALGRGSLAAQPMALDYFAPAEESPHARTWMCWPSTASIYKGPAGYFESVQETIGGLAAAIAEHEPVSMLVGAAIRRWRPGCAGPRMAQF